MQQFSIIAGSMLGIILVASLAQLLRMRLRIRRAIRSAYELIQVEKSAGANTALPACVRRYLDRAIPADAKTLSSAELHIDGEIRPTPKADWRELRAREVVVINKPALIWDAVIKTRKTRRSAQLIYVDETGLGSIKLFGVIPFMESHGDEADISLLSRFLTEAVWFPAALAPGGPISWKSLDENSARAVIRDGALQASATFRFDENGDVADVSSDDRYRDYRGSFVHEHFVMRCAAYKEFAGFRLPSQVSFAWQNHMGSGQEFEYARFTLRDIDMAFRS